MSQVQNSNIQNSQQIQNNDNISNISQTSHKPLTLNDLKTSNTTLFGRQSQIQQSMQTNIENMQTMFTQSAGLNKQIGQLEKDIATYNQSLNNLSGNRQQKIISKKEKKEKDLKSLQNDLIALESSCKETYGVNLTELQQVLQATKQSADQTETKLNSQQKKLENQQLELETKSNQINELNKKIQLNITQQQFIIDIFNNASTLFTNGFGDEYAEIAKGLLSQAIENGINKFTDEDTKTSFQKIIDTLDQ